jgi:hypothetical protein
MSEGANKAKKLKVTSVVIGAIAVVCLVFTGDVAEALSGILGRGENAEMTVIGVGIVLVLVFLYANTLAKKAAEEAKASESPNEPG